MKRSVLIFGMGTVFFTGIIRADFLWRNICRRLPNTIQFLKRNPCFPFRALDVFPGQCNVKPRYWKSSTFLLSSPLSLTLECGTSQVVGRVWARLRHSANPALQLKLSLSKFREKTRKEAHTKRFSSVRNCKLKQNVESIFYCAFKVHSKVTFQSHSTEHVCLILKQAWWTHLAIFNMSHWKHVQTLESFFAPNQSQSESEKNDTKEKQCINQKETGEDQRKPKKSGTFQKTWLWDHTWLCYEKEAMFCYFFYDPLFKYDEKSLDTNNLTFLVLLGSGRKKCFCWLARTNAKKKCWIKSNLSVPQNFSQGDKLSPSDQILAQTLNRFDLCSVNA